MLSHFASSIRTKLGALILLVSLLASNVLILVPTKTAQAGPPLFSVVLANTPLSDIRVPTFGAWTILSRYRFTTANEPMMVTKMNVLTEGESGGYEEIGIYSGGTIIGSANLASGMNRNKDIVLTSPLQIPSWTIAEISIVAKLPKPIPLTVAGSYLPRSGQTLRAGINANLTSGTWTSDYSFAYNIAANSMSTGLPIYMFANAPLMGQPMLLRKSKMQIDVMNALGTESIAANSVANKSLYRFAVTALSSTIALKKISFDIASNNYAGQNVLSNFALSRRPGGSSSAFTPVDPTLYRIVDSQARSMVTGSGNSITTQNTPNKVSVYFTQEERIDPGIVGYEPVGYEYELQGQIAIYLPVGSGDFGAVTIDLSRDMVRLDGQYASGYMTSETPVTPYPGSNFPMGPQVDVSTYPTPTADYRISGFVWSDKSDYNHSYAPNSSRDWTNGYLIKIYNNSPIEGATYKTIYATG